MEKRQLDRYLSFRMLMCYSPILFLFFCYSKYFFVCVCIYAFLSLFCRLLHWFFSSSSHFIFKTFKWKIYLPVPLPLHVFFTISCLYV